MKGNAKMKTKNIKTKKKSVTSNRKSIATGQKVLRVGIGGYGRSGCDIHARWLKEVPKQYRVVAVADELSERRADAVRDFGCPVYKSYPDLLKNTEMDLFINALPSFLHARGTIDAFKVGNNVVCEKPLARTVKDFDAMVTAGKKAKKLFAPFQNARFSPFFWKLQEVISSGVLGEIIHIRISASGFRRRWDWQTLQENYGGNLMNTGPHPMDHAVLLFGKSTPKVFCRMRSIQPFGGDAEDFCTVTLYGKNAPVIEVLVSSYLAYPAGDPYIVCGTYGGLSGGVAGLKWRTFDPSKAPKQVLWKRWSENRHYCSEKLSWKEKSWKPRKAELDEFQSKSSGFYNNIYDAITKGAKLVIKPAEVRRQIAVIEECHRQNRMPKRKRTRS